MKLACLVLAAGEGSRFGECKQLATINGKPMIMHCLGQLQRIPQLDVYTVVGAWRKSIIPLIREHTRIIEHREWRQGIGSSIACGIGEIMLNNDYDGLLIALADQIHIKTTDYNNLTNHFNKSHGKSPIVAAYYNNEPGVPAIFPSQLFSTLSRLDGDQGAKNIIKNNTRRVTAIPMASAAIDIDTKKDIATLRKPTANAHYNSAAEK